MSQIPLGVRRQRDAPKPSVFRPGLDHAAPGSHANVMKSGETEKLRGFQMAKLQPVFAIAENDSAYDNLTGWASLQEEAQKFERQRRILRERERNNPSGKQQPQSLQWGKPDPHVLQEQGMLRVPMPSMSAVEPDHKKQQRVLQEEEIPVVLRVDVPSRLNIDWYAIVQTLPLSKTDPRHKQRRKQMFKEFDPNGNGLMSLAEIEKGVRDVLKWPELLFKTCKPVFLRAYYAAANLDAKDTSHVGASYIEWREFRLLLSYLLQFLEYFHLFHILDDDNDGRLKFQDIASNAQLLKDSGADCVHATDIQSMREVWREMDADGQGMVLFDEFADWCMLHGADVLENAEGAELFEVRREGKVFGQETKVLDDQGEPQEEAYVNLHEMSRLQIDWDKLYAELPVDDSKESKRARKKLFHAFDPNGNGMLSLAEIQKGFRDVLHMDDLLRTCKPVFLRAYYAARNVGKDASDYQGADYVELHEFKYLLIYLRQYFEYFQLFTAIDKDFDGRLDFNEFAKAAPYLAQYGVVVDDPHRVFNEELDDNGGGFVLFDEFCEWATTRSLDVIKNEEEEAVIGGRVVSLSNHTKRQRVPQVNLAQLSGLEIDFEDLARKMPCGMSPEDKQARIALWKKFDENGNGSMSLAEIDKAIRDVLKEPELFRLCKPVFIRAFYAAKEVGSKKSRHADRSFFIHFKEFRLLLEYLQLYFRLFYVFSAIDANMDGRITQAELVDAAEMLRVIGLEVDDPRVLFRKMDADGKGMVLFKEMSDYLISNKLALAVGPGTKKAAQNKEQQMTRREIVQQNRRVDIGPGFRMGNSSKAFDMKKSRKIARMRDELRKKYTLKLKQKKTPVPKLRLANVLQEAKEPIHLNKKSRVDFDAPAKVGGFERLVKPKSRTQNVVQPSQIPSRKIEPKSRTKAVLLQQAKPHQTETKRAPDNAWLGSDSHEVPQNVSKPGRTAPSWWTDDLAARENNVKNAHNDQKLTSARAAHPPWCDCTECKPPTPAVTETPVAPTSEPGVELLTGHSPWCSCDICETRQQKPGHKRQSSTTRNATASHPTWCSCKDCAVSNQQTPSQNNPSRGYSKPNWFG